MFVRIQEMLAIGKMLWSFNKFSQLIFREMYEISLENLFVDIGA